MLGEGFWVVFGCILGILALFGATVSFGKWLGARQQDELWSQYMFPKGPPKKKRHLKVVRDEDG